VRATASRYAQFYVDPDPQHTAKSCNFEGTTIAAQILWARGCLAPWSRGPVGLRTYLRLAIEFQAIRYILTLSPFVFIGLSWNALALPMAQAPILMIFMIWFVEMRILRVPKSRRSRLMDGAEAERALDLLRVQSRTALTQIAAQRGMQRGELHLVVEQSELWRMAPLTFVTVQSQDGPKLLDLTPAEREIITQSLFQSTLSEKLLQRVNQSRGVFLHAITFDARGVSAHARLAAALA
jgi:hypothetical protein